VGQGLKEVTVFASGTLSGATNAVNAGLRGALGSAFSQGIGVATGLQSKFSFAGVAAAGVGAGIGSALAGNGGNIGQITAVRTASLLASAATRSALEGSSFGKNITAGLPDVLAQTLVDGAVGAARRGGRAVRESSDGWVNPVVLAQAIGGANPFEAPILSVNTLPVDMAGGAPSEDDIVVTARTRPRNARTRSDGDVNARNPASGQAALVGNLYHVARNADPAARRIAGSETEIAYVPAVSALQVDFRSQISAFRRGTLTPDAAASVMRGLLSRYYDTQFTGASASEWAPWVNAYNSGRDFEWTVFVQHELSLRQRLTGDFVNTKIGAAVLHGLNSASFGTVSFVDSNDALGISARDNPIAAGVGTVAGAFAGSLPGMILRGAERLGFRTIGSRTLDEMGSFTAGGSDVFHAPGLTRIGGDEASIFVGQNVDRVDGVHNVVVHGTIYDDTGAIFMVDRNPTHANQIAEAILANPNYRGDPIRLLTCYGGCGPAQELSDILRVPVWGATGPVGVSRVANSTPWVRGGSFFEFLPKGGN
jgi:hypothetical protein